MEAMEEEGEEPMVVREGQSGHGLPRDTSTTPTTTTTTTNNLLASVKEQVKRLEIQTHSRRLAFFFSLDISSSVDDWYLIQDKRKL